MPLRNRGPEPTTQMRSGLPSPLDISATGCPVTSVAAIRKLHEEKLRVIMLTGDSERTAQAVAREVGIDQVIAGVLPEGKLDAVRRLQAEHGAVAMVGDGVNDAPALAQAEVGITMATGSDVAIEAGDVTLMRSDLTSLATAIALSRGTMRVMRQNLFWAFAYNVIGIPIAAGVLYPVFGIRGATYFSA